MNWYKLALFKQALAPEMEQLIIRMYLPTDQGGQNLNANQIAQKMNLSQSAILGVLKRNNIQRRGPGATKGATKFDEAFRKQVVSLYVDQRMPSNAIAAKLGIGINTVLRILAKEGVQMTGRASARTMSPQSTSLKYEWWTPTAKKKLSTMNPQQAEAFFDQLASQFQVPAEELGRLKQDMLSRYQTLYHQPQPQPQNG